MPRIATLDGLIREAEQLLRGAATDRLPVDAGRVALLTSLIREAHDLGGRTAGQEIAQSILGTVGLDGADEDELAGFEPDDEEQYAMQHAAIARAWPGQPGGSS